MELSRGTYDNELVYITLVSSFIIDSSTDLCDVYFRVGREYEMMNYHSIILFFFAAYVLTQQCKFPPIEVARDGELLSVDH